MAISIDTLGKLKFRTDRSATAIASLLSVACLLVASGTLASAESNQQDGKKLPPTERKIIRLKSKADQAKQQEAEKARPKVDPTLAQMMAMSEPGQEQKSLEVLAGTWTELGRVYPGGEAEPWEVGGTMVNKMILGGRYLQSDWQGHLKMQKVWGRGLDGYNNVTKKHFSQWVDTLNTGTSIAEGESSPDGKVRTLFSEMIDPGTGAAVRQKSVIRVRGFNSYSYESFTLDADGKETKNMQILFTREASNAEEGDRREGAK